MEFGEKNFFVNLIYLISQVSLACTFLNFLAHCVCLPIFTGGQILNQPRGLPGKKSIKNIQKDQATLSSLGIKDASSMLLKAQQKKASDNSVLQRLNQESSSGKLAFKSQLSDSEKNVVRKIAQGSEELGMNLFLKKDYFF